MKSKLRSLDKPLMILAVSAALTAVLASLDFSFIEAKLYDLRVTIGWTAKPDREIVLVTIDDGTTKALNDFSPLSLEHHARFLEALGNYGPKAVGYLVDFNQVSQMNPEDHKASSGRFLKAAHHLMENKTLLRLGTQYDVTGEVLPPYPLSSLPHSIAVVHKDGNVFAEDKVTRRALVLFNEKPVFHLQFARDLKLVSDTQLPRGTFSVPEINANYFFFSYHGSTSREVSNPPYRMISFADVISGKVPPNFLKNKIVLVSTLTKDNWSDFAFTPYSKKSFTNPKLTVHANILDSVIHNQGILLAPNWLNWMTVFSVVTFVFAWVLGSSPLGGVFSTVSLGIGFTLFGHVLFQLKGMWLAEAQPLAGIVIGYYLSVPYRLIREYEKRWDYQRKNEILTQVEELKTNFLSLVTHDLKTPVARIQGLAEVLQRKASERLIPRDVETLQHIVSSTDELNHFISSILELSKIESNRLQIQFEGKDINQIIERAVDGFKAPARAKLITLKTNLEPLFPIRIDAALIGKVFNNLIDNAIKYSPEGSQVCVESKEEGDYVIVSVSDQGIGMSEEERENLFTRFYRAKNDTTTKIAGSGLGLYLTKYFIEKHFGHVEVESEHGKGSTFRIYLPLREKNHV